MQPTDMEQTYQQLGPDQIPWDSEQPPKLLVDLLETLVDGFRDAGSHHVTFDASALSSGIYLYQLTTGANIASGKMVLLK